MTVVEFPTGRAASVPPSPPRVLLVTKHPFMPVHDGTSEIISLWYECLARLGHGIDVLSFDYVHASWSDEGKAILARDGVGLHLVAAYGGHARRGRLASLAFASARGHRFAPEWLRTDAAARAQLDAVFARPYALIAIHGVDAAYLAGPERLRAHPAAKILDIHDHIPHRTIALQRTLGRLARWQGPSFLRRLSRSDMLQAVAWPSARLLARAEARILQSCDRILCSADAERAAIAASGLAADRLVPIRWPFACPPPRAAASEPPRHDLGFLGSGALFNVEALLFFCREIWPLIRAVRPEATLLVAGRAGAVLARLDEHARAGITAAGWIENVADFYSNVRIVAVPLLSGTGVSVKTMQAAAHGAAIVGTEAGLRGLALRHGTEVLRADTPPAFAAAVLALLDDEPRARLLGRAARAAMQTAHDPAGFARFLDDLVTPLLPTPSAPARPLPTRRPGLRPGLSA